MPGLGAGCCTLGAGHSSDTGGCGDIGADTRRHYNQISGPGLYYRGTGALDLGYYIGDVRTISNYDHDDFETSVPCFIS